MTNESLETIRDLFLVFLIVGVISVPALCL